MKYSLNPHIFFKVVEGNLVLWDYKAHKQYEIAPAYVERLLEISRTGEINSSTAMDQELLAAGVLKSGGPEKSAWGWDMLSEIFHIGTSRNIEEGAEKNLSEMATYEAYLSHCESIAEKLPATHFAPAAGRSVSLPSPDLQELEGKSLWKTLMERKTSRDFNEEPVSLQALSSILYSALGAVHGKSRQDLEDQNVRSFGYRRTSPAGGSVQSIDGYVIALSVDGLPSGVYQYRPDEHDLCVVQDNIAREELGQILCEQNFANRMGFAIVLVARFHKMWWKYAHSRAYRVPYLDAGHISQTFLLSATAHGLKTWLTGFFYDERLNDLLKIDGQTESALFVVGAGHGSDNSVNPEMTMLLEARRKANGE